MNKAIEMIESKRLGLTNNLLKSYTNTELNTDELLKEIVLLNDILKSKKTLTRLNDLIIQKEKCLLDSKHIQDYLENEKLYYEYVNKMQLYNFALEKSEIYNRFLVEIESSDEHDFIRTFKRLELITDDLRKHLFYFALKLYFNNRIKKSNSLLELKRIGVTSVADLTNNNKQYTEMLGTLELHQEDFNLFKKITNFKFDSSSTNLKLKKEFEKIEIIEKKINDVIYSRKNIYSF